MNKTILVIEDEKSLRDLLVSILQKENFTVLQAENGKTGMLTALDMHPDLVLLDLLMPVMGGMEALKEIRKTKWGETVPVIILTNLSANDENLIESMISERPAYYLIKSDWKIIDVVKKIKEILKI